MNAGELYAMLQNRCIAEGRILASQVAEAAGWNGTRRLDGVSLSCREGHGYDLQGYELKVSRSDLLRELKQPEKAEPIMRFLDTFWIVAGKGVCDPRELPAAWGLLVPRGQRLAAVKRAHQLEPQPLTKSFIVGFILRLQRTGELPDVQKALADAREEGYQDGLQQGAARERMSHKDSIDRDRLEAVREFEAAAGITIGNYSAGDIGNAVGIVLRGEDGRHRRALERLRENAARIEREIAEALKEGVTA